MRKSDEIESAAGSLPETEEEIRRLIVARLSESFGLESQYAFEVRSHGRSRTDLVLMASNELIAVEVKKRDWRRAIYQAVLNRYCVDRSYVALWAGCITSEVLSEASTWGLGVLSVSAESLTIVIAAPTATPDPIVRGRMLSHVTAIPCP